MKGLIRRVGTYVRHHGAGYTVRRAMQKAGERVFGAYDKQWRRSQPDEAELARQRANPPQGVGRISIVIPVYNTVPRLLEALVDSLLAQTYPDWEACLYDGASPREDTRKALHQAAERDQRIRVMFGETNEGISGNSNRALAMATGEWVALCDHDDLLSPDALWRVAEAIAANQPDMLYSDEDKVSEDGRRHMEPHFKPDFCPDNLNSGNYICHLLVARRGLMNDVGGFRPSFDGSQDHDLALRLSEHTTRIVHIDRVLYHWRQVGSSMSHQNLMRCVDAARRAVEEHIARTGHPGTVTAEEGVLHLHYAVEGAPKVSVLVLDSGSEAALTVCVHALRQTDWPNVEWLLVTDHPDRERLMPEARIVAADPANHRYAAMNAAMEAVTGAFVAVVDASAYLQSTGWLRELLMYAQRDDVGAVTPVLCDRRERITHGGFALGVAGIAQGRSTGLPRHAGGWHGLMRTSHDVGAVSGGCFLIRRDHVQPFDEGYRGGLGMADWCLRLGQRGLNHVYTPHAWGICEDRGLLLRGHDRDEADAERFTDAWGAAVYDRCWNRHFSRRKADYSPLRASEEGLEPSCKGN